MADYSQLMNLEKKKQEPSSPAPMQELASSQTPHRSTTQSTRQSTDRLTRHPVSQSTGSLNKILEKPKAFYITERLNQRIDEGVRYFQEKHNIKKVDRSVVLTAMLDNEAYWTEEALDLLVDRVINQLTHRLTNR
jgi:hypothetical protein